MIDQITRCLSCPFVMAQSAGMLGPLLVAIVVPSIAVFFMGWNFLSNNMLTAACRVTDLFCKDEPEA